MAVQQTIEWLDHHGIPYSDLCFMEEKASVGANLYVEDAPRNVELLRADGNEVICFANSTNRAVTGLRAETWDDVAKIVLEKQQVFLKG